MKLARRLCLALAMLGCSGGSRKPEPPPLQQAKAEPPAAGSGSGSAPADDPCPGAVDRVYALLARKGLTADPAGRDGAIAECRANPAEPIVACVIKATTDLAVENCIMPVAGSAPLTDPPDGSD